MEDSLSKEVASSSKVKLLRLNSRIRPSTTGDTLFAPKLDCITNPYVDSGSSGVGSRPRAPLHHSSKVAGAIQPKRDSSQRSAKKMGKKADKSSITELWKRLNLNNVSRSTSLLLEGESDIQFLNFDNQHTPAKSSGSSKLFIPGAASHTQEFLIPTLPTGSVLQLNILSTWGDRSYVGLMGIEVFDSAGRPVRLFDLDTQLWADPADINVLEQYDNDPRTVENLLDGFNFTCDDLHSWLAPFTAGQNHIICLELDEPVTISMIRVWNYNKSRVHADRGARYLEITLDDRYSFYDITLWCLRYNPILPSI